MALEINARKNRPVKFANMIVRRLKSKSKQAEDARRRRILKECVSSLIGASRKCLVFEIFARFRVSITLHVVCLIVMRSFFLFI